MRPTIRRPSMDAPGVQRFLSGATGQSTDGATAQSANGVTGQSTDGATGQSASGATGQSADGATGQSTDGATMQSADGASGQSTNGTTGQSTDEATMQSANGATGQSTAKGRTAGKGRIIKRRRGREVRKVGITFELELADKLAAYCQERDRDLSEVVGAAVVAFLRREK